MALVVCQIVLLLATGLPFKNVIFPHGNSIEVGAGPETVGAYINNRKFSDQSNQFIPFLSEQLKGKKSGWISTWNPHQQLGQPAAQLATLGKAYLLTHLISFLTHDPLVVHSLLFCVTIIMSGLFMFFFLEELALHPAACFVGAIGISSSVYSLYWASFLLSISGICWTIALLWLITRVLRDSSVLAVAGVSFCIYSLLLSGYPQYIVLFGYLLLLYTSIALWRLDRPFREKVLLAALILGASLIGILATLPAYLDTYVAWQRSARLKPDLDFFLAALPKFNSVGDGLSFSARTISPFWFGNPITTEYQRLFNGVGFGILFFWLFVLSVFTNAKILWHWYLYMAICFLATTSIPAYVFINSYMGFNFSRSVTTVGAVIPVYVAGSYAMDALFKGKIGEQTLWLASAIVLSSAVFLLWYMANANPHGIAVRFVLLDMAIVLIVAFSLAKNFPLGIAATAILIAAIFSQCLILARPADSIRMTSPLVERIRDYTNGGTYRYAKVGSELEQIIPSAQESLYGLKSIHSYDSLSPKSYHDIAGKISNMGTRIYGRHFSVLDADAKLCSELPSLMGISVVLSVQPIETPCLSFQEKVSGIGFYKPLLAPILTLQTKGFSMISADVTTMHLEEGIAGQLPISSETAYDDRKLFRTADVQDWSLLFLSEQYHPMWYASAHGVPLQTVNVNGFFQGVFVPPHTSQLELRFQPYVLWSWVPQVFYGVIFLIAGFIRLRYPRFVFI